MASVIPVRVGGGGTFSPPIVQRGGYAQAPHPGLQWLMQQPERDDTGTMLAILQFLSNQQNTAASRDAMRDALGFQRETLAAQGERFKDELAATQANMKDQLALTREGMTAAERRFSEQIGLERTRNEQANKALEENIKNSAAMREASQSDRALGLWSSFAPQRADIASKTVESQKDVKLKEMQVDLAEATGKATAGMGQYLTGVKDAVADQQSSWFLGWTDYPRKKAQEMADAARNRLASISDPQARAAAAASLKPVLEQGIAAIEGADWSSWLSTRGTELKYRNRYASPLYGVLAEIEEAAASAAPLRQELGIVKQAAELQQDIVRQQGAKLNEVWGAASSESPREAFRQMQLPTYNTTWPTSQPAAPASQPAGGAIQDPRGSGGPLDPENEALRGYLGDEASFDQFMTGLRR